MLQALGEDVKHLRETYDASGKRFAPNTKDVDWIPFVARNGWIAITSDTSISRVPVEVAALIKSGLIVVYMPSAFAGLELWLQAEKLCKAWPQIKTSVRRAQAGDSFKVSLRNGRVMKQPKL